MQGSGCTVNVRGALLTPVESINDLGLLTTYLPPRISTRHLSEVLTLISFDLEPSKVRFQGPKHRKVLSQPVPQPIEQSHYLPSAHLEVSTEAEKPQAYQHQSQQQSTSSSLIFSDSEGNHMHLAGLGSDNPEIEKSAMPIFKIAPDRQQEQRQHYYARERFSPRYISVQRNEPRGCRNKRAPHQQHAPPCKWPKLTIPTISEEPSFMDKGLLTRPSTALNIFFPPGMTSHFNGIENKNPEPMPSLRPPSISMLPGYREYLGEQTDIFPPVAANDPDDPYKQLMIESQEAYEALVAADMRRQVLMQYACTDSSQPSMVRDSGYSQDTYQPFAPFTPSPSHNYRDPPVDVLQTVIVPAPGLARGAHPPKGQHHTTKIRSQAQSNARFQPYGDAAEKGNKKTADTHISSILLKAAAYSQSGLGNLPVDEAPLQLTTPPRVGSNEHRPVQLSTPSSVCQSSALGEIIPQADLSLVSLNSSNLSRQGEQYQ